MSFEESRVVPGFEGYYRIDSSGQLYSCRVVGGSRTRSPYAKGPWKPLKTTVSTTGYAVANLKKPGLVSRTYKVKVHRLLFSLFIGPIPPGKHIDHVNGDRLDNSLCNLRLACPSQNGANKVCGNPGRKSMYKGLYWNRRVESWVPRVTVKGKTISCGTYKNELEAAIAYDLLALKHHGHYARTNVLKTADSLVN